MATRQEAEADKEHHVVGASQRDVAAQAEARKLEAPMTRAIPSKEGENLQKAKLVKARARQGKASLPIGLPIGLKKIPRAPLIALTSTSRILAPGGRNALTLTNALSCLRQVSFVTNWVTLKTSANS